MSAAVEVEQGVVPALEVRDLSVSIGSRRRGMRSILEGVSFSVMPGEAVGVVGESGSGKSLTSLAIMGLLPPTASITSGEVKLHGRELLTLNSAERRKVRGGQISMVLQDAATALDPSFRIRHQLKESLRLHRSLSGSDLWDTSVAALRGVRIPSPEQRLNQYPHELSGGMRQRVSSAIALAGEPGVLIADEPTTALDVTTQAQYLAMLKQLRESTGFALMMITHDLAIIRQMCDSVVVMYAGQVVETGPIREIIANPQHPYTKALFDSLPRLDPDAEFRAIDGQAPDPSDYPPGCRFAPRCEFAREECVAQVPALAPRAGERRRARCFGTDNDGWIEQ
jgi:oligopeptide/dipeptide ABC transporter ATP-binding protein